MDVTLPANPAQTPKCHGKKSPLRTYLPWNKANSSQNLKFACRSTLILEIQLDTTQQQKYRRAEYDRGRGNWARRFRSEVLIDKADQDDQPHPLNELNDAAILLLRL